MDVFSNELDAISEGIRVENSIKRIAERDWVRCCFPITPVLGRLKQESHQEIEARLDHVVLDSPELHSETLSLNK